MDNWDELQTALRKEVEGKYGATADLARYLERSRQQVHEWINAEVQPSYTVGMKMRKWLDERQKKQG